MKLKLTDLDPRFVRGVSRLDYEHTDNIREADGLQLQCPACFWADRRIGGDNLGHMITLWRDPESWRFAGRSYADLSLMAGRTMVTMIGGCARFYIRSGRVDFYCEPVHEEPSVMASSA